MRTLPTLLALACTLAALNPPAAAQGPMGLSLKQALDLAARQSYAVQNSELAAAKARARVKEVLAIGLPQVEVTGGLNNYIDVPTSVVPNFFGGEPEFLEVQFGVPWTVTGAAQLSQLLFDGSYLVGLEATRELKTQSEQELEKARADAMAQAAKAYLGALAAREGARLAAESVPVLEKSLREAEGMVQVGFLENTDTDRLAIALASARDRARSFAQQEKVALAYLRLVLGLAAETPLDLTDDLRTIVDDADEKNLVTRAIDLNTHIDHQLANTLVRLQTMDVRNQKAAYMPKLYGFLSHQRQSFGTDGPIETDWFPATLWGVNLTVPIWSSGMRGNRVKQANITLDQTRVNLKATEQRLLAEAEERTEKALAAEESYRSELASLDLAKRIFDRTSIKFTNGLASSFELNQDQGQYLQAQQLYVQRLAELLMARVDLRRSLDLY